MITFLAPAARCFAASALFRKRPVDSMTTSTPSAAHGNAAVLLHGRHDLVPIDEDDAVCRSDRAWEPAVDGVVLEQVCEHRRVGDVIDRDPFDVGAGFVRGAKCSTAGPSEAVDGYT